MMNSEIFTAIRNKKKINILLFNNYGCQCINFLQQLGGQEGYGNEFRYYDEATGRLDGEYVNVDYAMHAESMGCKTYKVYTEEELEAALLDAKKQTVSTLIEIMSVKGSNTHGYDSFWRIGVADVSKKESVQQAYERYEEGISTTKKY